MRFIINPLDSNTDDCRLGSEQLFNSRNVEKSKEASKTVEDDRIQKDGRLLRAILEERRKRTQKL